MTWTDGEESVLCLDAEKGSELWREKSKAQAPPNPGAGPHAGSRCTPVVADGKVFTLGLRGSVCCLDAATGKVLWRKETGGLPRFCTSSSPMIVDGKCVAFSGGIVAYDPDKGDEKWKWSGDSAAYGSPVLMTVDKTPMIVTLSASSLVGVGLADGKLLWKVPFKTQYNSVTPVVDGSTVILSTQGMGTIAYKIEKKDDTFTAKDAWKSDVASGIYNTPTLKDGLLYGLGGGRGSSTLYCLKADSGDKVWTDGTKRGECGGVLDGGKVLFLFSSNSELVVFKPGEKEFTQLAKYKVADSPTWAYPIIAGKRIFVKDRDSITLWTIE
jgi:outer membrane protein assembly factor BamB